MTTDRHSYQPQIRNAGVDGMLVSFGSGLSEPANRAALAFRAAVDGLQHPGILESSTSLVSTFVRFDLAQLSHQELHDRLAGMLEGRDWLSAPLPEGRSLWTAPAVFGGDHGPYLAEVAKTAGLDADQAVAALTAQRLRVQTVGFAPGMPYLGELPEIWDIPRATKLNPNVPAGGICLAIRQMVLFPVATQTGWHHIGQTALGVFDQNSDPAFVLSPGDEVQFQAVPAAKFEGLQALPFGGAKKEPLV